MNYQPKLHALSFTGNVSKLPYNLHCLIPPKRVPFNDLWKIPGCIEQWFLWWLGLLDVEGLCQSLVHWNDIHDIPSPKKHGACVSFHGFWTHFLEPNIKPVQKKVRSELQVSVKQKNTPLLRWVKKSVHWPYWNVASSWSSGQTSLGTSVMSPWLVEGLWQSHPSWSGKKNIPKRVVFSYCWPPLESGWKDIKTHTDDTHFGGRFHVVWWNLKLQ